MSNVIQNCSVPEWDTGTVVAASEVAGQKAVCLIYLNGVNKTVTYQD